jgi:heme/copper-type cytochrome/quinol oxidase subunit 2
MVRQRKIAILLTIASCVWSGVVLSAGAARGADPNKPANSVEAEFEKASKEALELLQRDAARAHADWIIVATAAAGKWQFTTVSMRKGVALPKPDERTPGKPEHHPPLTDIVVPQGARVIVDVTSNDDIYPFVVPGLAIDRSALPGRLESVPIDTTKPGFYPSTCASPCSARAKDMMFAIHVVDIVTFKRWLVARDAASTNTKKQ